MVAAQMSCAKGGRTSRHFGWFRKDPERSGKRTLKFEKVRSLVKIDEVCTEISEIAPLGLRHLERLDTAWDVLRRVWVWVTKSSSIKSWLGCSRPDYNILRLLRLLVTCKSRRRKSTFRALPWSRHKFTNAPRAWKLHAASCNYITISWHQLTRLD